MASTAEYQYDSQLPYMFGLVAGNGDLPPGVDCAKPGLTVQQSQLWDAVCAMRDEISAEPQHHITDYAIQQYILELRVWCQFWPEPEFPGIFPTEVLNHTLPLPLPTYSGVFQIAGTEYGPHSSSPAQNYQVQPPALDDTMRAELRNAIIEHKGVGYVPVHGWDEDRGLPSYAIVCNAPNSFLNFCGPDQKYFRAIKKAFYPIRIMYQRGPRLGLMVIWIEARCSQDAVALTTNPAMWNAFKSCWAFFRTWVDQASSVVAKNVMEWLVEWKRIVVDLDGLDLPLPLPLSLEVLGERRASR